MKRKYTILHTLILLLGTLCLPAATSPNGYVPYHQYLQQQKQQPRHGGNSRDYTAYAEIAYLHLVPDTLSWTYADSGSYFYNSTAWRYSGYTFTYANNAWSNNTYDTISYVGWDLPGTDLVETWNGTGYSNSAQTTETFSSYFVTNQTYQTFPGPASVYSYTNTYDGAYNLTSQTYQTGSSLTNDSLSTFTYDGAHRKLTGTIQYWNGTSWNNYLQQTYIYPGTENEFIYSKIWNGTAWVLYSQITVNLNQDNEILSYAVDLYDSTSGYYDIPSYQELYTYDNNYNLSSFASFNYSGGNWVPVLQYNYSYDSYNDLVFEQDASYNGSAVVATDQYYYYYTSIYVAGVEGINNAANISVYPNPVSGNTLNLNISGQDNAKVTIGLYDIQGCLVQTTNTTFQSGNNNFQLALPNLASGSYYLRVLNQNNNQTSVLKFVKE